MENTENYADLVFSGIFPRNKENLALASASLNEKHFLEREHKFFFRALQIYYAKHGGVVSEKALRYSLRSKDEATIQMYMDMYDLFVTTEVPQDEFRWAVGHTKETAIERQTGELLAETAEILKDGKFDSRTGETLFGHEDARTHLLSGFVEIDTCLDTQETPEGDMREDFAEVMAEYESREQAHKEGTSKGILFGIDVLDNKVGGLQRGELDIVAAYSSDGKSALCSQTAWSASVEQGANVLFLTTETLRDQIRRRIIARHSRLDKFSLPEGLNSRDLKAGTLSPENKKALKMVMQDFQDNQNYGKLFISQVPRGTTLSSLEQIMYRHQQSFNIDLVVMDYLALLVSDRRRGTEREELAAIMKEAKQIATTFNNGKGVPFLSPWQVNRDSYDNAQRLGRYTSASLSGTAEATNSADVIVSLLAPVDSTSRYTDVTAQVLKNRDGETADDLIINVDYATCMFRSKSTIPSFGPASTSPESAHSVFGSLI